MLWKIEQKHTESIQTLTTCLLWNRMKSFWVFLPYIWLDLFIMLRSNVQTRKNNNNKQMFFYTCLARTIQTFISLSHKQINNIDLLGFVFTHFCLFWKFALALEEPNVFMFVLFLNENYLWLRLILFVFFIYRLVIWNCKRGPFGLSPTWLSPEVSSFGILHYAAFNEFTAFQIFTWSSAHVSRVFACFFVRNLLHFPE